MGHVVDTPGTGGMPGPRRPLDKQPDAQRHAGPNPCV